MRKGSPRYDVLGATIGVAFLLIAGSSGGAGAQTPCNSAAAPQCDGACPVGQDCEEQSGVCTCRTNPNPCGVDQGPPLCYGECPPANPICADVGGACQCVGGSGPTPTATPPAGGATPTPTATPTAGTSTTPTCEASPIAGCRTPAVGGKAFLSIKKHQSDDRKDMFLWKWLKGSATSKVDFGSPTTTTSYLLCVYDGNANKILDSVAIGGDSCESVPCWKETARGFMYKDKDKSPSGPQKLLLKEGADGKAQAQVKGKGSDVDPPSLPLTQPVTVQLINSDGQCWEAVYSAPALKNDGGPSGQFKDKAD